MSEGYKDLEKMLFEGLINLEPRERQYLFVTLMRKVEALEESVAKLMAKYEPQEEG